MTPIVSVYTFRDILFYIDFLQGQYVDVVLLVFSYNMVYQYHGAKNGGGFGGVTPRLQIFQQYSKMKHKKATKNSV